MYARPRIARPPGLAGLALLPPASFAVHQLRYWLAYGDGAAAELQRQGHSYLHSVVPWLVIAIALAAGGFLRAFARAVSSGDRATARARVSFASLWLLCAISLVVVYAGQEMIEGAFAAAHPPGLKGVLGGGGWWSVPAAAVVGLVLAVVFRGANWVLRTVARHRPAGPTWPVRPPAPTPSSSVPVSMLPPLAGGWSRRGPPRRVVRSPIA